MSMLLGSFSPYATWTTRSLEKKRINSSSIFDICYESHPPTMGQVAFRICMAAKTLSREALTATAAGGGGAPLELLCHDM